MTTRPQVLTAGVLAAIAAAAAIPALTGAQTPTTREIVAREKVRSVTFVKAKASTKGDCLATGDRVLTRQAIFDAANAPTGTLFTDCANVGPAAAVFQATLQCTATYRFRDGQIASAGIVKLSAGTGSRFPIVGGSGAYRSARGEVEAGVAVKGYDSVDLLHLQD